jgi:hypothetical protein
MTMEQLTEVLRHLNPTESLDCEIHVRTSSGAEIRGPYVVVDLGLGLVRIKQYVSPTWVTIDAIEAISLNG